MNLTDKIAQYQQEADDCMETETKAHKRRVELNDKDVKKQFLQFIRNG